jgi:recombination protein RecT
LVPGYKGLIQLAYRSGRVQQIVLDVVREGDGFSYQSGLRQSLRHDKRSADRPITHAYAGASLDTGHEMYKVMTTAEVEAHKERYAKGWKTKDSPWNTPEGWPKMAQKTCYKQLFPLLPLNPVVRALGMREENIERGTVEASSVTALPEASLDAAQGLFDGAAPAPAIDHASPTEEELEAEIQDRQKAAESDELPEPELKDDAKERINQLGEQLERCDQIKQVEALRKSAVAESTSNFEKFTIHELTKKATDRIRAQRGERTNA